MLLERLARATCDSRPSTTSRRARSRPRFYPRLHIPALPQLRTLSSYIDTLDRATSSGSTAHAPIPRRLVEQAVSLGRDFVADAGTDGTMIHGDLHYENVLAADREPWLVIDPKPMSGDPHYEVAPLLWNRWDEVVATATSGQPCVVASTRSSTPRSSTRTGLATGSWSG